MNARSLRSLAVAGPLSALALFAACADSSPAADAPDGSLPSDAGAEAAAPDVDAGADADATATSDAGARTCSDQNFCRTPVPEGQLLSGVWGDGEGAIWAVSEGGSILRWDGSGWTIHTTNQGASYSSIWGTSPTDIWVGGTGTILHGTGATSSAIVFAPVEIPPEVTVPIRAFWGPGPDEIWAAAGSLEASSRPYSAEGYALHYSAGSWTRETSIPTDVALSQVWGTPSSGVWFGGTSAPTELTTAASIHRRAASATEFVAVTLPPAPASSGSTDARRFDVAAATSDTTVVVLGAVPTNTFSTFLEPAVWRGSSDDGGATFTWTADPRALPGNVPISYFTFTAALANGPNDIWAAGDFGRLEHWDGTAWSQAALALGVAPEVTPLRGLWGKTSTDFWVVGGDLAIHKQP